jgi:hypothetical protein
MPRSRAYRRYKRYIKLARRYRLLEALTVGHPGEMDPRALHWHIRCGCFADKRAGRRERRRRENGAVLG